MVHMISKSGWVDLRPAYEMKSTPRSSVVHDRVCIIIPLRSRILAAGHMCHHPQACQPSDPHLTRGFHTKKCNLRQTTASGGSENMGPGLACMTRWYGDEKRWCFVRGPWYAHLFSKGGFYFRRRFLWEVRGVSVECRVVQMTIRGGCVIVLFTVQVSQLQTALNPLSKTFVLCFMSVSVCMKLIESEQLNVEHLFLKFVHHVRLHLLSHPSTHQA